VVADRKKESLGKPQRRRKRKNHLKIISRLLKNIMRTKCVPYAKPNVVIFNTSILIQFNIYLFNSVRICSIQSLHSFNLIRIYSI